jgi:WD40 repeat protein
MAHSYEANIESIYRREVRLDGPISVYPCINDPAAAAADEEMEIDEKESRDVKEESARGGGKKKRGVVVENAEKTEKKVVDKKWGAVLFQEWENILLSSASSSSTTKATKGKVHVSSSSSKGGGDGSTSPDYLKALQSLSLNDEDCAKVTEARIVSTILHPTTDKILCIAGDKTGVMGIWDVNHGKQRASSYSASSVIDTNLVNPEGVYKYRPHIANITTLHCWESSASKIYSTSYDGTVRCLDVNAEQFDLIHEVGEELFDNDTMIHDAAYLRDGSSILLGLGGP